MKRQYILGTVLTILLMGGLVYFYGGSQAPAGQAPLERLTPENLANLKTAFNAASNDVRALLLLSPT
jgi:hypothetical protein